MKKMSCFRRDLEYRFLWSLDKFLTSKYYPHQRFLKSKDNSLKAMLRVYIIIATHKFRVLKMYQALQQFGRSYGSPTGAQAGP